MNKLILIITIVFSGMLMQAQMKKATKIIIQSNETSKEDALNNFIDYLMKHDIYFMDINESRGMAKSERFSTFGFGNWETLSTILVIAKEVDGGVNIIISGSTLNGKSSTSPDIKMINKHFMGNVGGVLFDQVNSIAKQYENKFSISYST